MSAPAATSSQESQQTMSNAIPPAVVAPIPQAPAPAMPAQRSPDPGLKLNAPPPAVGGAPMAPGGAEPAFQPNPIPPAVAPSTVSPYAQPGYAPPGFPVPALAPGGVWGAPPPAPAPYAPPPAPAAQPPAPVVMRVARNAAPAPPPPPPPPTLRPYLVRGESAVGRRYDYAPAPTMHPLITGARRIVAPASVMVPASADYRGVLAPPRDGGEGPGAAAAAFREMVHTIPYVRPDGFVEEIGLLPGPLSAAYIRQRAEKPTLEDELLALLNYGACPEAWYLAESTAESVAADVAAFPFRLRATPDAVDTSMASIKYVLANKQPVLVGHFVYASFETAGELGRLKMLDPAEPVLGGHAVLVVGYDEYGWIVRDSAGPDRGDGGHVVMPYGYEVCWFAAWTVAVGR